MSDDKRIFEAGVPKYLAVARHIREEVVSGMVEPGSQLPGERVLATQLGVAPMTMRRALDHLVQEGLLERRPNRGTFVRAASSARNLCLLVLNMSDRRAFEGGVPWFALEAIRQAARGRCRVRVMSLPYPDPPPQQMAEELRKMNVGAVGLLNFRAWDVPFVRAVVHEIPCVLFLKDLPGIRAPCAACNPAEAGHLMVDFLVERGARRIAMAPVHLQHSQQVELSFAVQAELARRGLEVNRRYWFELTGEGGGAAKERTGMRRWMADLLSGARPPDGWVLVDEDSARCLARTLASGRLRLGRDVQACYLASTVPSASEPGFGVLHWNVEEAVRVGAHLLMDIVTGRLDAQDAPLRMVQPRILHPRGASAGKGAASGLRKHERRNKRPTS